MLNKERLSGEEQERISQILGSEICEYPGGTGNINRIVEIYKFKVDGDQTESTTLSQKTVFDGLKALSSLSDRKASNPNCWCDYMEIPCSC